MSGSNSSAKTYAAYAALWAGLVWAEPIGPAAAEDVAPVKGEWIFHSETDPMTDGLVLNVELASAGLMPSYLNRDPGRALLAVWCDDNTTTVTLLLGGWFVSDAGGFGRVDYRIDGDKAKTVNMEADATNIQLMLYGGKRAIPFVKTLLGRDKLLVRAAPFNEQPIDMTFNISGLEEAIKPVREACGW